MNEAQILTEMKKLFKWIEEADMFKINGYIGHSIHDDNMQETDPEMLIYEDDGGEATEGVSIKLSEIESIHWESETGDDYCNILMKDGQGHELRTYMVIQSSCP